ncbi:ArsR/SmtB family transcription factor [Sporosalibacterium faouarense]|uniref:ArsR/SmtB family transcription factor n=1 Tax=Sporosalibacterium faouarense TaxID=516123 RepID=UPI00141CD3D8|nr:metalloregulator ArsR/SmtB family transcription factor [Sporosalibacterium faouarense]MTI49637.1 winged helix-turn-helix transcriptional regulator [Bacillota bacterium]
MNDLFFKLTASYLKALSHPTRLKIINILKEKELCVCVILEKLDLEQSNVSQHLRVLKEQNIVESRRDGSKIMYKVKDRNVFFILNKINDSLLKQLSETQDQLKKGGL